MIINAISVEPKRRAEIKRISTETGMLEAELDARHYEIVYPFANEKRVAVIKDEFASLDGKPFNRAFYSAKTEENVEIQEYAQAYAEMKPKEAAGIFEAMTNDLDLAARILGVMEADERGKILGVMDPEIAAKITKIMDPES